MYKTFYAKNLFVFLIFFGAATFLIVDITATFFRSSNFLDDKKLRMILLEKGIAVTNDEPAITRIRIPEKFDSIYSQYNELQKTAGYNIEDYKDKKVLMFTYRLSGSDKANVNVIVYKNRIIGGDITADAYGTGMLPLMTPEPGFGE